MSKAVKAAMLEQTQSALADVRDCFVVDYSGIDAVTLTGLRHTLREKGVSFRVVKNSTAMGAFKAIGVEEIEQYIVGPSAVVFGGDDAVVLAKSLDECSGEVQALEIRGGVLDGKAVTSVEVKQLAQLPSREQLLGEFILAASGAAAQVIAAAADAAGQVIGANVDRHEDGGEEADA